MTKKPKKADSAAKRSAPEGTSEIDLAEEQQAHQEHLQRLKKYKKKRKQQIIGLVLEVILLAVVIVAFSGVSYMKSIFDRITIRPSSSAAPQSTQERIVTTAPTTINTLPTVGPVIASTTAIPPSGSSETLPSEQTDVSKETEETTTEETTTFEPMPTDQPYTNPLPDRTADVQSGYYTFACFGVDDRDEGNMEIHTQGDVCIIMSINKATGEINLVSVFRDFYFEYATGSDSIKLTDAYARYGAEEVMYALNRNFDLTIQDYIIVNWTSVADVVDAIGGLDMYLSLDEAREINNYIFETRVYTNRGPTSGVEIKEGMAHLDGVNAVCYCRIRHNVGSDYGRAERQRKIIAAVMEKAKNNLSVSMVSTIIDKIADNLRTTLDPMQILMLASKARDYSMGQTVGFPIDHHAMNDEMISSGDYLKDVSQMHQILFNDYSYVPSDNVKRLADKHHVHTYGY